MHDPGQLVYYELVPLATLRALRNDEIETAVSLFAESANDMAERHGVGIRVLPPQREGIARVYGHIARTGIFRVAEADGRIVALACGIVRGPWWFLSGFWAQPGLQGQGIGGPLLDEAIREGERAGARVFFTWSSLDPRAMATYLRRDLLPGWPILILMADAKAAGTIPEGYEIAKLDGELISALAKAAGHPARDQDHAVWRETSTTARAVAHHGELVGYFYARPGSVGPLAWTDDAHAPALLDSALAAVAASAPQTRLNVPGVAHAAVRHLLARGAKLLSFGHLLATEPPGEMTRYLPSGPLLF